MSMDIGGVNKCGTCKYMAHWQENQAPLGSGRYWPESFQDCTYAGPLELPDEPTEDCPAYEELPRCPKHPDQYQLQDGCPDCEYEYWQSIEQAWSEQTQEGR